MNRWVLMLLLLMLVSCSRNLSKDELPGLYRINVGSFRQEVRIGRDGAYVNALYRGAALIWLDQGSWAYDESGGQKGITFDKFRFGIPEYSTAGQGYWFVVPERSLGGTKKLCFDPDLDRCFEGQP